MRSPVIEEPWLELEPGIHKLDEKSALMLYYKITSLKATRLLEEINNSAGVAWVIKFKRITLGVLVDSSRKASLTVGTSFLHSNTKDVKATQETVFKSLSSKGGILYSPNSIHVVKYPDKWPYTKDQFPF